MAARRPYQKHQMASQMTKVQGSSAESTKALPQPQKYNDNIEDGTKNIAEGINIGEVISNIKEGIKNIKEGIKNIEEDTNDIEEHINNIEKGINNLSITATDENPEKMTFDTFTCFPELPTEIQLKIWRAAANLPRLVVMTEAVVYGPRGYNVEKIMQSSKNPQPAVLQVCRQARYECLQSFQLICGTRKGFRYWNNIRLAEHVADVYFNATCDTLYISGRFLKAPRDGEVVHPCNRMLIKANDHRKSSIIPLTSIALDVDDFKKDRLDHCLTDFLYFHQSLREIILVVKHGQLPGSGEGGRLELVKAGDRTEREDAGAVMWKLARTFRQVEQLIASDAEWKFLRRCGPTYWAFGGGRIRREIGTPPSEEALQKYHEMIASYKRPLLKIKGLAEGGVRL